MEKQRTPHYHGFRIYISSSWIYFFLVFPFMIFVGFQAIPEIAERKGIFHNDSTGMADSLLMTVDTISKFSQTQIDSLADMAVSIGENLADSMVTADHQTGIIKVSGDDGESVAMYGKEGPFVRYFILLFFLTFFSYLVGMIYNHRFKRYFKRKRYKLKISDKLKASCKRGLLRTPVVNGLIIILPNLLVIVFSLFFLIANRKFEDNLEIDLFVQFFYLTLVATLLEFMFAYFWQKHRVHLKYIDYIYTKEELKVQVFRRKGGKIRNRFLISSGITTFLPLLIVMVYLILSITPLKKLELESLTPELREVLIGPFGTMIHTGEGSLDVETYRKLFYVNAGDSLLMIIGICNGILVSFIYLLVFVRWTNQDITRPVKELLVNIRNTRAGEAEQYTVVRTNDEIGELAEGYNEMTKKIHDHVAKISRMNRDLEKTVKERTQEVVMQKEEIEAQKEEIEAQLDLTTQQRDTITRQKDQILDSIRYAERIQSAILPPARYLTEFLSDYFILFKPRDIVSGDFYWNSIRENKILIAVADCTGHGVPGAFLSVLGISSMNEIINRKGTLHASKILEHLRDFVIHSLHQTGGRGEAQDGIEIALCVIDPAGLTLEFAGANRPLYLVRSRHDEPGKSLELMHIKGDKKPIGLYEQEPSPFNNHQISLQKNDTIYLFSDGYVDQLGGPRRKTFRSVHFRELLLEIQDRSLEDQKQILLETHESWRGDVDQIDDILVVGIRI